MSSQSPPRVALISSRFPFGSREAFLREEIRELEKYAELFVVPAMPGNEPPVDGIGACHAPRIRAFSARTLADAGAEFFRAPLGSLRALSAIVRGASSPVFRLQNVAIFPKALAVARYVRRNRIEHVHAYWLSMPATIASVVHELTGVSWSATGHRYDLVGYNLPSHARRSTNLFSSAAFVRTISHRGLERVARVLAPATPVFVEHLGIRCAAPAPNLQHRSPVRFVCIAGMERVKGHEVLLRAFAAAVGNGADTTLTLIGEGSLRLPLEQQANALGIERRVEMAGALPHEEVLRLLESGAFDVAILASRDEGPHLCEGIPVSLMECMAAGLPVVATRSGAVTELVDERTGILCAPGDVAALSSAITTIAQRPDLRARLGYAGRWRVENDYNVEQVARRLSERFKVAVTGSPQAMNIPPLMLSDSPVTYPASIK